LLVKGEAGTGKTTFALEILRHSENPYYISSRIQPASFVVQFPEMMDFLPPDRIIDAAQIPEIEANPQLRESQPVYEKIQFRDLPEFFEILVQKIEDLKKISPPTIVIDTWDAIVEMDHINTGNIEIEKQNRIEQTFSEWVRQINVNIILITEHATTTALDTIADGIILLQDQRINDLRVRTIELQKLRSVKIRQPAYIFSLEGAHFRSFEPYRFRLPEILLRPEKKDDLNMNTISTGMQSFDDFLQGGYSQGSWNLFELSKGVGQGFLQLLIPTLVNHLTLGRGVVAALPEGISLKSFEQYLEGFVESGKIAQQFTIFDRSAVIENVISKAVTFGETLSETLEEMHRNEDLLASIYDLPVLKIYGLDKLEHVFSPEDVRRYITSEVATTKNSQNIALAFIKEEQSFVGTFSHLATMHYKLELIDKALVIRGIQPQTSYVALYPVISGGYLDTKFIPIV